MAAHPSKPHPADRRPAGLARIAAAVLLGTFAAGHASAAVQVLKKMPAEGSIRHGEVVYVDDGRCPAGEVKKITGGNLSNGTPRQVQCVKRPDSD